MPDVLSIREAVRRCQREGLPVTEYALRGWIKSGEIPVRRVGSKALIYFPNLAAYLRHESVVDNSPAPVIIGGYRRVERG